MEELDYSPKGTYHLSNAGYEEDEIRSLIRRRRQQILIHSCLYYHLDQNIISDKQWDVWAKQLLRLQKQYPEKAKHVDWHWAFKDFDGTTGMDLPLENTWVLMKAKQLLRLHESYLGGYFNGERKENRDSNTIRIRLD